MILICIYVQPHDGRVVGVEKSLSNRKHTSALSTYISIDIECCGRVDIQFASVLNTVCKNATRALDRDCHISLCTQLDATRRCETTKQVYATRLVRYLAQDKHRIQKPLLYFLPSAANANTSK